jgi:hypothetical protein
MDSLLYGNLLDLATLLTWEDIFHLRLGDFHFFSVFEQSFSGKRLVTLLKKTFSYIDG